MPSVAIRESGAVVEHTDYGSAIRWSEGGLGETPATLLERVIARMRYLNDKTRQPSRQQSLAITNAEQALHWLRDL
jgi:hypothetical protein